MTTHITCRCCPRPGRHDGILAVNEQARRDKLARIEDYVFFREQVGLSREAAASRLGVSMRTVERYERALRQGVAA
jgi:DNA-binding transcriptional regulator YiaG